MSIEKQVKFKEPLDQLLSVARAACQSQPVGNAELLAASALDAGQAPFMRTTPDGYGAREADWLSPAAMAKRVRFAMGIAANRIPLAQADPDNARNPFRLKEMNEGKQRSCGVPPANLICKQSKQHWDRFRPPLPRRLPN